jgi:hypothetical protein
MADDRLRIHVLADKSNPEARAATLPQSPAGTWPVLDAVVLNRPKRTIMTQNQVQKGIERGWIVGEGHRVQVRPAGPASDPWLQSASAPTPHVFHHYDALVIGKSNPVRYRVTRNPDKYVRGGSDTDEVTDELYAAGQTDVVWHYELELEKG